MKETLTTLKVLSKFNKSINQEEKNVPSNPGIVLQKPQTSVSETIFNTEFEKHSDGNSANDLLQNVSNNPKDSSVHENQQSVSDGTFNEISHATDTTDLSTPEVTTRKHLQPEIGELSDKERKNDTTKTESFVTQEHRRRYSKRDSGTLFQWCQSAKNREMYKYFPETS